MLLKSLEIHGFKSFPDKTVLSFGQGMTAVVGPNGSGKSNISDAIRWVLGEQSTKSLRGSKMEDVIFNGTAQRKPVGFAEVSLVIDNRSRKLDFDADDVKVTRRYYRSGESEYLINNATVRLKDVQMLFMDTGLGRDGYSIIGQGRIGDIVASKSEERREIFEEAAGEAMDGFEAQMEDIARQAQELAVEMDNIRRGAQQLEEEAARCDGDVAVLRNDIYHNKENTARIEEEIRLSAEGDSRIEEDIAARQADIRGKREAIARAEAEQLALSGEMESLAQSSDVYSGRIDELSREASALAMRLSDIRVKSVTSESSLSEITIRLSQLTASVALRSQAGDAAKAELTEAQEAPRATSCGTIPGRPSWTRPSRTPTSWGWTRRRRCAGPGCWKSWNATWRASPTASRRWSSRRSGASCGASWGLYPG